MPLPDRLALDLADLETLPLRAGAPGEPAGLDSLDAGYAMAELGASVPVSCCACCSCCCA